MSRPIGPRARWLTSRASGSKNRPLTAPPIPGPMLRQPRRSAPFDAPTDWLEEHGGGDSSCGDVGRHGRLLADRRPPGRPRGWRWPTIGGLCFLTPGLQPLMQTNEEISTLGLLGGLGLAGGGIGLSSAGLQTAAIESVGPRRTWRHGSSRRAVIWAALSGPACWPDCSGRLATGSLGFERFSRWPSQPRSGRH